MNEVARREPKCHVEFAFLSGSWYRRNYGLTGASNFALPSVACSLDELVDALLTALAVT